MIVAAMKILVIGSGGREHALCWKLAQTKGVEVFAAPGNPGAARTATCVPVLATSRYLEIASAVNADLTVVGPEAPLGALGALGGQRLVIEEFLRGEEITFIALCDGKHAVALAPTQDHKAAFDGDRGPNTGGMGAYSDAAILTEAQMQGVMDGVI